jgi:ribosome maturation factor RimP
MTEPHDSPRSTHEDSGETHEDHGETASSATDVLQRVRTATRVLEEVVGPVISTMGYELVHLEWAITARPRVLRLYVDKGGAMTLDDCAKLSPILGNALDAAEHADGAEALCAVLDAPYVLEVSSPGIERPLSRRSQIDRHTGARATIRTHAPLGGGSSQKTFHGRLVGSTPEPGSTDDRDGRVSLQDDEGVVHEIPLSLIRRANLVYEPVRESDGPRGKKAVNRG